MQLSKGDMIEYRESPDAEMTTYIVVNPQHPDKPEFFTALITGIASTTIVDLHKSGIRLNCDTGEVGENYCAIPKFAQ